MRYCSEIYMLSFRDVSTRLSSTFALVRPSSAKLAVEQRGARPVATRCRVVVLSLVALVAVLDQAAKWWAWRNVPWAKINSGGDLLVGHTIGAWYANPVTGALLDLLDFGLLSVAVVVLARPQTSAVVRIPGALMVGGWGSNLLDRLGIHYWTAPGSVRGVVDFIHLGGYYYNLADFFIIGCTPLFLLAVLYQGVRAATRRGTRDVPRPAGGVRSRAWPRVWIATLVGVGLTLAVALGAANYGGVKAVSPVPAQHTGHRLW